MENLRALSIRQPYAEEILRGWKPYEQRFQPTNVRGRVYIYASLTLGDCGYAELHRILHTLPRGKLVGTVEIVACEDLGDETFAWWLANPKRLRRPVKPLTHPQPVWFYPFAEIGKGKAKKRRTSTRRLSGRQ